MFPQCTDKKTKYFDQNSGVRLIFPTKKGNTTSRFRYDNTSLFIKLN